MVYRCSDDFSRLLCEWTETTEVVTTGAGADIPFAMKGKPA